jgi:hypothetical protein
MTGHRNKAMTELLVQAVREGWDYYITETPWPGYFLEAAANYEKKYFGLDLAPEDITLHALRSWGRGSCN